MKRAAIYLLTVLMLTGCFKEESYDTTLILKPTVQRNSGSSFEPYTGVKAYAFDADTTLWAVLSYEDALKTTISLKGAPATKSSTPLATAEPYAYDGTTGWLQMSVSTPSLMLLAVDEQTKVYAYTQVALGVNLPQLYVSLPFMPWKKGKRYKTGNWVFCNDFYVPAKTVEYFIAPLQQKLEAGDSTALTNVKVYAYDVDTTSWRITTYNNALNGVVSFKTDTTKTLNVPAYTAYDRDGKQRMEVTGDTLMVVVVDKTNKLYGYTRKVVDVDIAPVTDSLVFHPWSNLYQGRQGIWNIVNDAKKPVPPKTTSNYRR